MSDTINLIFSCIFQKNYNRDRNSVAFDKMTAKNQPFLIFFYQKGSVIRLPSRTTR